MVTVKLGGKRRAFLAGAACMLAAPSIAHAEAAGVALVIGNSKYRWEATLANVKRDAPDMARAFQAIGLRTELLQDVTREAFQQAIDRFATAARGARVAAFYYAGHGASWNDETFLVPVDADLATPDSVKALLPVSAVTAAMKEAANRLLVFDNCRNNPADGWRQLAAVRAANSRSVRQDVVESSVGPNTLALYSTAPGRVALDGAAGDNSPFAAVLLRYLAGGSVDLQSLPARLRRDLLIATQGRQVLWDQNTYQQPFPLGGARASAQPPVLQAPAGMIDLSNTYAFARQNDLPLPEGLVAFRPRAGSPDAGKAGAFSYTAHSPAGIDQRVLLVLSIDEQRVAEVVVSGKGGNGKDFSRYWRFVPAKCSDHRLELVSRDQGSTYVFDWSDANSGSVAQIQEGTRKGGTRSSRFVRLDG